MMPPRTPKIEKLKDEFGQFDLLLRCEGCGHTRKTSPHIFAKAFGWDALLSDVIKKLRCSKCDAKKCTAQVMGLTKPRGLRDART